MAGEETALEQFGSGSSDYPFSGIVTLSPAPVNVPEMLSISTAEVQRRANTEFSPLRLVEPAAEILQAPTIEDVPVSSLISGC